MLFTRDKTNFHLENVNITINLALLVKKSSEDKMVIISAGVTLHESIKAYEKLS